ncbi:hypothetical protein B0G81_5964 [Paraburkholderia sp. BL6665CI2N2]|uniref:hypothetical protein n=1 Tax=Paraburkholderia sp. BL6665CI2N2 TaxID=1938806 RepID=UPI0010F3695C|nr:hypothetical protein [Paraburkholderia sp. BL6665CI2N2]TDY25492.1 hypothetical protein B0G81_5964 [Paraburkholderia sp. BL6665CI2N2]
MLIQTIVGLASAALYAYLNFSDKHSADKEVRETQVAFAQRQGEEGEREVSAELRWHSRVCAARTGQYWMVSF